MRRRPAARAGARTRHRVSQRPAGAVLATDGQPSSGLDSRVRGNDGARCLPLDKNKLMQFDESQGPKGHRQECLCSSVFC